MVLNLLKNALSHRKDITLVLHILVGLHTEERLMRMHIHMLTPLVRLLLYIMVH